MKRVLVFGMTENPGGVESFILNYFRNIDRTKIRFDFLCNTLRPIAYEEELKQSGADIYYITPRRNSRRRFSKELKDIFRKNKGKWDAIWVNVCSLANIDYLIYARQAGIRRRIIHSHNSENMEGFIRRALHEFNKRRIRKYATDFWACSDSAARWFYKETLRKQAVVIPNAIDVQRMRYDESKRMKLREQYGWNDCFVIGNIGRLHFQKNQQFLLDVFQVYYKTNNHSILILVGQGEDRDMLKARATQLGLILDKDVFFVGVQSDIQAWLSCFDLFCFPSRFEGLSIAAMEAEANGLPVLASDCALADELRLNTNVRIMSLKQPVLEWSESIQDLAAIGRADSNRVLTRLMNSGFDIKTEAMKLEKLLM